MEFLSKYGFLILVSVFCLALITAKIIQLAKEPEKIKNWLVYACAEAEKLLGSGTGQLKLRTVYDMFIKQFPAISMIVSFETFSKWVDIALVQMREMIENNQSIKEALSNEKEEN